MPEEIVLQGLDPRNFRRREWRRILQRAGLGHRTPKDLRDTFASQLLTAGVQLGYVSKQLGHADVAVTAKHYARWAGGDLYRLPLTLLPGEVPADFIARLEKSPHSPPTVGEDSAAMLQDGGIFRGFWSGKRGSNPRPSAWEADALPTELFPRPTQSGTR